MKMDSNSVKFLMRIACISLMIGISELSWAQSIEQLHQQADSLIENYDIYKAHEVLMKASNTPGDSLQNARTQYYYRKLFYQYGMFTKAEELLKQSLDIHSKLNNSSITDYLDTIGLFGNLELDRGQYEKAISYFERALLIIEKHNIKHDIHVNSLCGLAKCYFGINKLPEGKKKLDEAIRLNARNPDIASELLIQQVSGEYYLHLNDLEQSSKYCTHAMETSKENYGENSVQYVQSCILYSTVLLEQGKHQEAEPLLSSGLKVMVEKKLVYHPDLVAILTNLGVVYLDYGYYDLAIQVFNDAIKNVLEILGKHNTYYLHSLNGLAIANQYIGNFEIAEPLHLESLQLRKEMYGEDSRQYINAYINIAGFYQQIGSYEQSRDISLDAIKVAEEKAYTDLLINALNSAAVAYYNLNDLIKAIEYYDKAVNLCGQHLGMDHPTYFKLMGNLLGLYNDLEPDPSNEKLVLYLLQKAEELYDIVSKEYLSALLRVADFYLIIGNLEEALECSQFGMEILDTMEGDSDSYRLYEYRYAFNRLVTYCETRNNNINNAGTHYLSALELIKEETKRSFAFMSEAEKENFIRSREYTVSSAKSFFFKYNQQLNDAPQSLYDIELFNKNLLLNSSTLLQSSIINSQKQEAIDKWKELKTLKTRYFRIVPDKATAQYQSELLEQIKELEKELARESKSFQSFQEQYNISWKDIVTNLDDNEVVIEFAFCQESDSLALLTDELLYYALILRNNSERPEIIFCCKQSHLNEAINGNDHKALYNLVWKPLIGKLTDKSSIYIAPCNSLNDIAFNALQDESGTYLLDKYNIHQLLSSKDLISLKDRQQLTDAPQSIALFGGADFLLPPSRLTALSEQQLLEKEVMRSVIDDAGSRAGFDYLKGSRDEVTGIAEILNNHGWDVSLFTDLEATEVRFRQLNSHAPSVIHVSTHGFYIPYQTNNAKAGAKQSVYRISDNPLIRSGLVLTGANSSWLNPETITDTTQDGILTAYEISNMDLSNTKLAVLSACNTGKGDIKKNEGTYGLQRALRLAGVESMIVTLREIYDEVTVGFMKDFYSNWMEGSSVRESFILAQRKLKTEYPDDVSKWGGFVLIE